MSLTSHLKDSKSPVYQLFNNQWFKETKNISKIFKEQINENDAIKPSWDESKGKYNYSLVGTAFDYRFRYYFTNTPRAELTAAKGASLISDGPVAFRKLDDNTGASYIYAGSGDSSLSADYIISFFEYLESNLEQFKPARKKLGIDEEQLLNRCCLVLGEFEMLSRSFNSAFDFQNSKFAKLKKSNDIQDLLNLHDHEYVDDLCRLSWASFDLYQSRFASENFVLNPTFEGSKDIGGADADLILDNSLIEIKTTLKPCENIKRMIYQLLGYVLLDYRNQYQINQIEIFLPRQKSIARFPLHDILTEITGNDSIDISDLRNGFMKFMKNLNS